MKKALIISYYWPPAGGPGVQRVLNIVEHLTEFGWEPIVLSVKNPSAPAHDDSLLSRIPSDIKVFCTETREPFNAYKKLTGRKTSDHLPKNLSTGTKISFREGFSRWIRANLFIPDARSGWKPFLVKEGLRIIDEYDPDIIFSTSPPHSLQLGAMQLARLSGKPWIADLRDPWTEAYWETQMPKTKRSRKKNSSYEKSVLDNASAITTVGEGISTLLKTKTETPVSVIYNGFREIPLKKGSTDKFEIVHLGNLSAMQSCEDLVLAIASLSPNEKEDIELVFIGSVAEEHRAMIAAHPDIHVKYHDFLPYEDMVQKAQTASILYLPRLNSSYSKGLISAKLFDYLALQRPILAVADKDSDIAGILKDSGCGKSFDPGEINAITRQIVSWKHQQKPFVVKEDSNIKRYSCRENVRLLSSLFEKIIENK